VILCPVRCRTLSGNNSGQADYICLPLLPSSVLVQTDGRTNDMMMPIADYTVYDRLETLKCISKTRDLSAVVSGIECGFDDASDK